MVVTVCLSPPTRGRRPQLNMLQLVDVANNRYSMSKLEQKGLPQGFCYACSRIDPSTIFKQPNRNMFQKAFLSPCEHFPKPPDTTFILEDHRLEGGELCGFGATTPLQLGTDRPMISVTLRRKSQPSLPSKSIAGKPIYSESSLPVKSTAEHSIYSQESPPANIKPGRSFEGPTSQTATKATEHASNGNTRAIRGSIDNQLPALRKHRSVPSGRKQTTGILKSSTSGFEQSVKLGLSKQADNQTQTPKTLSGIQAATMKTSITRITIIPTADVESRRESAELSHSSKTMKQITKSSVGKLSRSSPEFSNHSKQTRRTLTLQSKEKCSFYGQRSSERTTLKSDRDSMIGRVNDNTANSSERSFEPVPYINPSDGLTDTLSSQPLLKETASLETSSSDYYTGGRTRGANRRPRAAGGRGGRAVDVDSRYKKPDSAAHLRLHHRLVDDSVPYPGFDIPSTPSAGERTLLKFADCDVIGKSSTRSYGDTYSTNLPESNKRTDAMSLRLSISSGDKFTYSTRRISFCRCSTSIRDITSASSECRTCGKSYKTTSDGDEKSLRNMGGNRSVGELGSEENGKGINSDRTNVLKDEYFRGVNSLHGKDGSRNSNEGFQRHFDNSPESWFQNKKRGNNPLIDPDIHDRAYMRALQTAQYNSFLQNGFVFDDSKKLRRPNVFSYYSVLPYKGPNPIDPEYIGLKPDMSVLPKKGQYMKHIFGNLKLDDFYESPKSKDNDVDTGDVIQPARTLADVQETKSIINDQSEKSSVSLRMKTMDRL